MPKRRRKSSTPLMLFWSKREQARFIQAAERFTSLVNDLGILVEALSRAPAKPARRRAGRAAQGVAGDVAGDGQQEADK